MCSWTACAPSRTSHAVECGNADAGGEVSVGTSAHSGLLKFPVDVLRNGFRLFVKGGHSGCSFHRHSVDAAFDAKLAVFVEWPQGTELAIESRRPASLCLMRTSISTVGLSGDYVGASPAANYSRVHRDALLQIVELRDCCDLARELNDGAVSFAGIESGVRRQRPSRSGIIRRRLCAQSSLRPRPAAGSSTSTPADSLAKVSVIAAGRMASDLFVRNEKDGDGPRQALHATF